jgi:hypothetical protein
MLTEEGLKGTFEALKAGDYIDLEIIPISEAKYKPYDMCVVSEMGIDENEKIRSEKDIDVGNMFRFTGNRYEIIVSDVDARGRVTHVGIMRFYGEGIDWRADGQIMICPVLSWSDVGELTLDGISKLIPAFMVEVPNKPGNVYRKDSVAVGMVVGRHLRAGK